MDDCNSYRDIYCDLVCEVYRDVALMYSVTQRLVDVEIGLIRERYRLEGISFLTKGLPLFGKAIHIALATSTPLKVTGFKKVGNSAIPKFLGWLLERVFKTDGTELDQPDPYALKHFRQIVYLVYKLEIPYEEKTCQKVIDSFMQAEADLSSEQLVQFDLETPWILQARDLITRVVSPLDPFGITPKHGPGAVATGEDVFGKTRFSRIYPKLEQTYPFTEWFQYNLSHVAESCGDYSQLSYETHPTAKVVLVQKDSRGPRLISCEPLEVQWIQQGLRKLFYERLESYKLTRGHVNIRDQSVNRRLALRGSKNGKWVTLDMKEASDRVSLRVVQKLFGGHPSLLTALEACRSEVTRLPNGMDQTLQKFAPMGSALCFPVMALVLWSLSVSALRLNGSTWREALSTVYVYGDDIIVRTKDYKVLLDMLPKVGLKFNLDKCCTARSFRESCGCDAYRGVDVTPVKLKTVWSHRRRNPESLCSYVAFSNAMFGLGFYQAAQYVRTLVERMYGKLPCTSRWSMSPNGAYVTTTGGVAWAVRSAIGEANLEMHGRYNADLCRQEYRTWKSEPVKRPTTYDGYAELLRRQSDDYGAHGGLYALVRRNRLKRTWIEV